MSLLCVGVIPDNTIGLCGSDAIAVVPANPDWLVLETCEVGSRVTSLKQRCHSRALTRFVYVQAMQMLPWTVIDLTDEWASHLKGLNTSSAERHDAALTSGTDHDSATDRTTPPPTESARPRKSSVTPRGFGLHLRHRHMSGSRLSLSAMRAMAGSPSGRPPSAHSTRSLRSFSSANTAAALANIRNVSLPPNLPAQPDVDATPTAPRRLKPTPRIVSLAPPTTAPLWLVLRHANLVCGSDASPQLHSVCQDVADLAQDMSLMPCQLAASRDRVAAALEAHSGWELRDAAWMLRCVDGWRPAALAFGTAICAWLRPLRPEIVVHEPPMPTQCQPPGSTSPSWRPDKLTFLHACSMQRPSAVLVKLAKVLQSVVGRGGTAPSGVDSSSRPHTAAAATARRGFEPMLVRGNSHELYATSNRSHGGTLFMRTGSLDVRGPMFAREHRTVSVDEPSGNASVTSSQGGDESDRAKYLAHAASSAATCPLLASHKTSYFLRRSESPCAVLLWALATAQLATERRKAATRLDPDPLLQWHVQVVAVPRPHLRVPPPDAPMCVFVEPSALGEVLPMVRARALATSRHPPTGHETWLFVGGLHADSPDVATPAHEQIVRRMVTKDGLSLGVQVHMSLPRELSVNPTAFAEWELRGCFVRDGDLFTQRLDASTQPLLARCLWNLISDTSSGDSAAIRSCMEDAVVTQQLELERFDHANPQPSVSPRTPVVDDSPDHGDGGSQPRDHRGGDPAASVGGPPVVDLVAASFASAQSLVASADVLTLDGGGEGDASASDDDERALMLAEVAREQANEQAAAAAAAIRKHRADVVANSTRGPPGHVFVGGSPAFLAAVQDSISNVIRSQANLPELEATGASPGVFASLYVLVCALIVLPWPLASSYHGCPQIHDSSSCQPPVAEC